MAVFRRDIDENILYKLNLNDIENGTTILLTKLIAGQKTIWNEPNSSISLEMIRYVNIRNISFHIKVNRIHIILFPKPSIQHLTYRK